MTRGKIMCILALLVSLGVTEGLTKLFWPTDSALAVLTGVVLGSMAVMAATEVDDRLEARKRTK